MSINIVKLDKKNAVPRKVGQEYEKKNSPWLDPQTANIVLLLTFVSTKVDRDTV